MKVQTYDVRVVTEVAVKDDREDEKLRAVLHKAFTDALNQWRLIECGNAMTGKIEVDVRRNS